MVYGSPKNWKLYERVAMCGYSNLSNYGLQKPFASLYWSSKGKADRKPPYLMGKTIFLAASNDMRVGYDKRWLVVSTPLKTMSPVSWDDYSQLNGKIKFMFQNHQPGSYMLLYDPTCLGVPRNVLCKRLRRQGDPATEDQHRQGFTPLSS